jgi:uncharacterized protein (TIGR00297 family)
MMDEIFSIQQLIIGIVLAVGVGLVAWLLGALATSGAVAAAVLGSFIFGFGGLPWAALMLTFFISSSVLSKTFSKRKAQLAEKFAKGSRRDWAQVFANGGIGAFLIAVQLIYPEAIWPWLAYAGAMATVNADTWATELGVLSPKLPCLITTGKQVQPGTSGGVSLAGTGATLAGAALVALVGSLFPGQASWWQVVVFVLAAGFVGAFIDSLLGATVQALYYDPVRRKETERRFVIENGSPTEYLRGWEWINNDVVNFLSSLVGAVTAVGLWFWLGV